MGGSLAGQTFTACGRLARETGWGGGGGEMEGSGNQTSPYPSPAIRDTLGASK